jgi:oxygen-independent coproporphyrinogen-3 oxidase
MLPRAEAYELVRNAGFKSVNLDLLFGAPGQKLSDWQDDLRKAVELEPDHISTYCLTFEEDTALYAKLSKGELILIQTVKLNFTSGHGIIYLARV